MKKRILSFLLALVMVLSVFPIAVLAEDEEGVVPDGAVAYVTTTGETPTPVGEGDNFGSEEEPNKVAGYYKTLQAAINACPDGVETTITMVGDELYGSNSGANIVRGKNIILDLNGKIIATYEPNTYTSYTIHNNGTLTITDSSATLNANGIETAAGTGLIACYATSDMQDTAPSPGYATNTITNQGTLNFYAGTVINQTMDGDGGGLACYCVDNQTCDVPDGVYFNMYAGEMQSFGGSVAVRMNLNGASMTNKNVVNMQGGTIGSLWVQTYGKDEKDSAFELTLNNATVLYNVTLGMSASTVERPVYSNVTITDSIFGSSFSSSLYVDENNTVTISGLKAKGINMTHPEKLLSDGYFMDPVADGYIVDTYHCNPNTDEVYNLDNKKYNYVIDQRQVEQENAFKVIHNDGTEESFIHATDAAAAVKADGETIQVLKDTNEKIVAPTDKSVIIDLNGKTVSNYVKVYGGAEFIDSSEVKDESGNITTSGTGKIVSDEGFVVYDVGYNSGYIKNKTLKFTSGTFISHAKDGDNTIVLNYYNYYNDIVINGGTFITDEDGSLVQEEFSGTYLGGLTINGGYIDTLVEAQTLKLVINGGEITGYVYQYLPDNYGSSMKITGGTMGTVYAFCLFETVDISGGHIKGDLQSQARYNMNISGNAVIDGDVLFGTYGLKSGGLTISGGTFNGDVKTPWYSQNGITITNGTFNGDITLYAYNENSNIVVSDGMFNGKVSSTVYHDGQMAITGGTFNDTVNTWTWAEGGSSATHDPCITGGTFDVVNNCTPYKLYVDNKNNVYSLEKVNFIDYETIYTTVGMLTKLGYTYEVTNTDSGYVSDGKGNSFWTQELTFTKGSNTKVFYVKNNADGYTDSDRLLKSTNCVKEDYILQEAPFDKLSVWQAKGKVVDSEEREGVYDIYYGYLPTDTSVLYPDQKAIGYTVLYNGGDTFTLKPFEIKVDPTTIETKLDDGSITATEGDLENYKDKESAKEAITDMMNNSAVGNFVETKIDENTGKLSETVYGESFNISMVLEEAMKAINEKDGVTASVTANGEITVQVGEGDGEKRGDVDLDKQIIVSLEAAQVAIKTEEGQSGTKTTMINESTYDVTPKVTITYTNTDGEKTSVTTTIPNEAITAPITFRLPIDSKTKANFTKVYHSDDATNFKKEVVGERVPIQTDPATGERYVELSASSFSYYTCENINAFKESNVVAIRDKDGIYYGFDSLDDAIAAFNEGEGTTATGVEKGEYNAETPIYNARDIILLKNVASSDFKNKQITLELNGLVLSGTSTNAEDVTVTNISTPKATLAAVGVYKNDVKEFVADGYYVKTTNVANDTVYVSTDPSNFTIEVITSTTTDRDSTNNNVLWEVIGGDKYATEAEALAAVMAYQNTAGDGKWYLKSDFSDDPFDTEAAAKASQVKKTNTVDVYADDTVTVKVVVNGARFTAADVTLTWDDEMFTDTTKGFNLPQGWGKASDGKSWRFATPKGSDSYYEAGTVLGTFTFKAKYLDEETIANATKNPATFTVKNDAHPAKVIGGWGITLEGSDSPVPTENLKDDTAKILLIKSMTGSVEGKTNLIYKGSEIEQKLLNEKYNDNKGWSAKVGSEEYAAATIEYAVLTPENAARVGTQKKNGSDQPLYIQNDGTVDTTETATPALYKAEDFLTYGNTAPTGKDAGTYTVYYRIKANGYQTVESSVDVTIAKQKVNLEWTAPTGFNGNGADSTGEYNASGFLAPTAKFSNLDGGDTTLTAEEIVWTTGPNANKSLKDVGTYTFTAQDQKNYTFNNPVATVKVTGKAITGWQLTATGSTTDPTTGVIWRDGTDYPIGKLVIADGASIKVDTTKTSGYSDADGHEVTNVKVVYEYSTGTYDEEGDEIWTVTTNPETSPMFKELGTYKLRMTVTADNYEKLEQTVTFQIKNPIFKIENLEYVAGYSIVLVYTDETGVAFRYNNTQMYDVTKFGYKYNNNQYNNGTANYKYVYATVVKGAADTSLVYASNNAALQFDLPDGWTNMMPTGDGYMGNKYVNDVNNKYGEEAKAELKDVTAIQSIYNVNATNMLDMQLVLRSDVNRDKKVDVGGDVAQALAFYLDSTKAS